MHNPSILLELMTNSRTLGKKENRPLSFLLGDFLQRHIISHFFSAKYVIDVYIQSVTEFGMQFWKLIVTKYVVISQYTFLQNIC
jgi:hypothetical protein